ncbi:MAG: 50S ribosomal protein L23 [Bacteroidales bacterium]|nr:50S ribosomal protein L23 [Bacteroidales bacterium]
MDIIVRPLVTEKMNQMGDTLNKYGFMVHKEATKLQIKREVEKLYNVKVADVNTIVQRGKRVSRYTKAGILKGRKSSYKKAIVTLAEGQKIDFYSNI